MDNEQIRERERIRQNPEQFRREFVQQQLARMDRVGGASRVLFGVFGMVFFGAGLCMLGLIWTEGDDVPLFGKLFGSLICMAFLAFGGFMVFGAFARGKGLLGEGMMKLGAAAPGASAPGYDGGYQCPNCGAALGEKADVSPMGDVKCAHCGRWFNVHKNA